MVQEFKKQKPRDKAFLAVLQAQTTEEKRTRRKKERQTDRQTDRGRRKGAIKKKDRKKRETGSFGCVTTLYRVLLLVFFFIR